MSSRFAPGRAACVVLAFLLSYGRPLRAEEPPPEIAAMLKDLVKLAATAPATIALPPPGTWKVEYFAGQHHTLDGVLVHGVRPVEKPGIVECTAFHSDANGTLQLTVDHRLRGEPHVSSKMLYEEGRPVGRLHYTREGLVLCDCIAYQDGQPYLLARIWPNGKVLNYHRMPNGNVVTVNPEP